MVKEEKTIDGFAVRSAKDSKLVARSKAEKIPTNKTLKTQTKKVRVVSDDDPLVTKKAATKKPARKTVRKTSTPRRASVSKQPKMRQAPAAPRPKVSARREIKVEDEERFDFSERDKTIEEEIFGKEEVREEAHEDFIAPVESFDLGEEDLNGTSEGRVEEVEDEEVVDMKKEKKSRKELRKEKKLAKLEAKKLAEDSPEKKKKSKKGKVVGIILLVLLLILLGAGAYFYFWGDGLIRKMTGGEGSIWSAIGTLTSEKIEPLKTDANGRTNILIYGTSGYEMEGSGHDGAQLTDSIMVVSLDQENGDVAMVSLPRDLKAGWTCTATGKINEVYWCNNMYDEDEAAGATALQEKIAEILGVETQYYVHLNWGALVSIVDTLGGVTVTLDEDVNDWGWTNASYQAGVEYALNGEEALGLARARHGTYYGDFSRGNSQQKLIIAIKNKILEKGLGLTEVLSIVGTLGDNVRTNFGMGEIKTGMHLLEEFDLENIRQIPLVGETYYMTTANINGISYVIPSAGEGVYGPLQSYIFQQLKSSPAEREGAEILVLNGTEEDGVASEERARLEKKGYVVKDIANAPEGEYEYTEDIEVYDTSEGTKPETRQALEDFYGVEIKDLSALPNGISPIGYDFIIIVGESN
ncbi:LCP family protein [Candidatus Saccharibacteria bacterium]|nr:LCP family protein [Candidatus Saccharibacteria bacterium]